MIEAAQPDYERHVSEGSQLGELLEMQPTHEESHTPTLSVLEAQQKRLRKKLRTGFGSRREILYWSHTAAAVSAGMVPGNWFKRLINDQWAVAALFASETRRSRLMDSPPSPDQARTRRTQIIQNTLSPAFQKALRVLRRQATDYTENEGVSSVERQQFLALRPRLHERAVHQHSALRWAFADGNHEPIQSREDATAWLDKVAATCPDAATESWVRGTISPMGTWYQCLVQERGPWLESQLAGKVLPAMNDSLRRAALEGSEMPDTESADTEVPTG